MILVTLLVTSGLAAALALVAWRRRNVPGAPSLTALLLAVAVWALADALAAESPDLASRILLAKFSYLGIASIGVLWLQLVLQLLGPGERINRGYLGLLWILPIVTLTLAATNESHRLVWSSIRLVQVDGQTRGVFEHGPWFWVAAGYNYLLVAAGAAMCAREGWRGHGEVRTRSLSMLAAAATPAAANLAYLNGSLPFPGVDPTPLAFAVTGAISAWSIFGLGLLDVVPIARDALLENLGDGVVVLDAQGRVAEGNQVAQSLLGLADLPAGMSAGEAFASWPELARLAAGQRDDRAQIPAPSIPDGQIEVRVWSLRNSSGQPTGRLILLRDVTMREHAAKALKKEEENFRLAFEANPFPLTITRLPNSQVVSANKAALAFLEVEAADLAASCLMDFYAGPGERGRTLHGLDGSGQISDVLMEFRTRAGRSRWALVNAFPLEFAGEPCLLSGYADITERKLAEEALAKRTRELAALYETSLVVNSQPDIQSLLRAIVERATDLLEVPMGGLHLLQADRMTLKPKVSRNLPAEYSDRDIRVGEGLIGRAAQTGEPVLIPDVDQIDSPAGDTRNPPFRRALAVPLQSADRVIGVLSVYGDAAGAFVDDQVHLVHLFADQAAIALENARLYAEVQRSAVVDDLTNIYNRRGMVQFGEREFTRSARFARPLSALMVDLDHFKNVNDTLGHAAGDCVLQQVADCLRAGARSVDILARYGGDELLVLLPEADLATALLVAERLRHGIERTTFLVDGEPAQVTASFGVAALGPDTPDLASLIARADAAAYLAKQAGRNCVATAGSVLSRSPLSGPVSPSQGTNEVGSASARERATVAKEVRVP